MFKKILGAGLALILAVIVVIFIGGQSNAATSAPQVCYKTVVDVPAHDDPAVLISYGYYEYYQWVGDPHEKGDPPAFPSADWDDIGEGDPHGNGREGTYYVQTNVVTWYHMEWVPDVWETKHVDATYKQVEVACPTQFKAPVLKKAKVPHMKHRVKIHHRK